MCYAILQFSFIASSCCNHIFKSVSFLIIDIKIPQVESDIKIQVPSDLGKNRYNFEFSEIFVIAAISYWKSYYRFIYTMVNHIKTDTIFQSILL